MAESAKTKPSADELAILRELEKKVLWLASWTIHHANHLRENVDGVKVGGHQASSASLATIMTALYFRALRPQDRVAVKPHASPIYHAIQYLLGRQSRQKLEDFRGYKGAQSYPSRSKDADDVDFSTGSVGLGVAQTLFSSLVQDYVRAHGWGLQRPEGRMIALVGDAELDEGNIFEAILEGWKQGLRNCWQAPSRRDRRPRRPHAADRDALRRGAGASDDQPRGARPAVAARSLRKGRSRPPDLLHLLHHQGLRPAVCRPQGQSRRADDAGADREPARGDEYPAGT
jgi:pyruvate dehydrogenase E1 component